MNQKQLQKEDRPWLRSGIFVGSVALAASIAVCGFAPQGQTPTPAPAPAQPAKTTPTEEFVLSCKVFKPAALGNFVAKVSQQEPKALEKGLDILTSPRVRTLDGYEASISFSASQNAPGCRVRVLPQRHEDGTNTLRLELDKSADDSGDKWTSLGMSYAAVRQGSWYAMAMPIEPGSKLSALVLVKVEINSLASTSGARP